MSLSRNKHNLKHLSPQIMHLGHLSLEELHTIRKRTATAADLIKKDKATLPVPMANQDRQDSIIRDLILDIQGNHPIALSSMAVSPDTLGSHLIVHSNTVVNPGIQGNLQIDLIIKDPTQDILDNHRIALSNMVVNPDILDSH